MQDNRVAGLLSYTLVNALSCRYQCLFITHELPFRAPGPGSCDCVNDHLRGRIGGDFSDRRAG